VGLASHLVEQEQEEGKEGASDDIDKE